ncbi:TolC family protein [Pelagicoccus sp. SDUM812005]|uniref:TolC family protein n=1 Tax=Pelagicoccus sp. SDUM812005 TaxID=3041257 RepID=UPI00280D3928|nr:TolC family protein [Pelagicoccus sp. SDUM812005]MDQ8180515.1 TolC family protein [Pelagicoccus sp. SDUM812005]
MNFRLRNPFNRLRLTVFAIGGICGGATLWAQGSDVAAQLSSLEDYLERAQAANPQLTAFERRYEAARERIPLAAALPDPMFQVTHFVESVQTRNGPQENVFMASQKIPWFGTLDARERAISEEAEALWFAYQSQQLMLARTVASMYYEYGFTQRATQLTEENVALLEQLEPIVEERVKSGGDLNALLRLKVEIGKVSDRLQSLRQARVTQSAKLSELLALPHAGALPWPEWRKPDLVAPDAEALLAAIEASNPELQMLERKIASAGVRSELAKLGARPDFTVGLTYMQIGELATPAMSIDSGKDAWGITFGVNVPLWTKKNRSAQAEAALSRQAFESEYENRLNALKADLASSLSSLVDANRRLKLYGDELLGLAEQAVENSRASYQSGRTGILEVIDSERSLLELQMLYWRAAADAWQQLVTAQAIANQPILGTFQASESK